MKTTDRMGLRPEMRPEVEDDRLAKRIAELRNHNKIGRAHV